MARFVVANRTSGAAAAGIGEGAPPRAEFIETARDVFAGARDRLAAHLDVRKEREPNDVTGRWQFQLEGDADDLQRLLKEMPRNVVGEPALARHPATCSPRLVPLEMAAQGQELPSAGVGSTAGVTVRALGKPLVGAHATLVLADANGRGAQTVLARTTGPNGDVSFPYDPRLWVPVLLMVEPLNGFWDWWQAYPPANLSLDLPALPKTGPIGWWHLAVGIGQYAKDRAAGIRIGVVDSGVGPHPYLAHVRSLGAVVGAQFDPGPQAGLDVLGHGTHVTGIIAARPVEGSGDFAGIASGAEVVSIRVFPPEGNANQGDIAEAIDRLALERVDLVNLSLGGPQPSQIEQDAVRTAVDLGTLCIGAAGNGFGQPVIYPAAYPEVAAVSAIGVVGAYPAGTLEAQSLPPQPDRYAAGYLFLANFSNIGPELTCTGPGVGIISTVPARPEVVAPYAVESGTSMAAPVTCAALATVLAQDSTYRGLPRSRERVQRASAVLGASLRPLGLSPNYVGSGLSQAWPG